MSSKQQTSATSEQTTAQRFEAKYPISEMEALAIRDYIQPYLTSDDHVAWGEPYTINSLYLDNAALRLYWSSVMGEKNRIKLRIRAYTEDPQDPVIFEIKRRVDRIILKERTVMRRDCVPAVLNGETIPESAYLKPTSKEKESLQHFRFYMESLQAQPKTMVRYKREAYMSNLEEPVRITFDRALSTLPVEEYSPDIWEYGPRWMELHGLPVILEIKFTNTFPFWVAKLIQRFNLTRDSFAKYVACLDHLKRDGLPMTWACGGNEDALWSSVL